MLIQHNDSPLKAYDQDYVKEVMQQLETRRVSFHLNTGITQIDRIPDGYLLSDGETFQLKTDLVFCTAGRFPSTAKLNLEKAGVDFDKEGNQSQRSSADQ
ncbi:MAG: FAD-dependent oxidoreductase [Alkalibacterium sp.]|nr:FAD-dependent oxidoreductase [Alkalibacterium sp.]